MDNLFSIQSAQDAEDMTAKVLHIKCAPAFNRAMENILRACEAGENYAIVAGIFSRPEETYLTKYFEGLGYTINFDGMGFELSWEICPTNSYSTEVRRLLNGEEDSE